MAVLVACNPNKDQLCHFAKCKNTSEYDVTAPNCNWPVCNDHLAWATESLKLIQKEYVK